MVLSNAERQQRFRDRQKQTAQPGKRLTPEQIAERSSVVTDPLYPIPPVGEELPRFMGWTRYEWSEAPVELVDYFDLREAWDSWQAEKEGMIRWNTRSRRVTAATQSLFRVPSAAFK